MPIGPITSPINDRHQDSFSPSSAGPSHGAVRSCKKQPIVILSKAQRPEYGGAAVVACEAVWLKRFLKDLGIPIKDLILLYCDNMSNIYLAHNLVFHAWIKHIEVHYHFIREHVLIGDIDLWYISTNLQIVDIFTKTLEIGKLWYLVWEHTLVCDHPTTYYSN